MLVMPICSESGELLGVLQLINHKADIPFSETAEEGAAELAQTLAVAPAAPQRPLRGAHPLRPSGRRRRAGRRRDGAGPAVRPAQGVRTGGSAGPRLQDSAGDGRCAALAKFFGVPYEPARGDRIKPLELLKHIKREFVDEQWLPLEETPEGASSS